jgi:broad specificity phosphatase PhoE
MKIYILRHEDRTQDCSFFSPLTKPGLENSAHLVEPLTHESINMIISSPFIRTLQTIYPYSKESQVKINLEYGLIELHHEDLIPKKAVGISLPEYLAEAFNYNPTYKTIIKPTEITYPEKIQDLSKRVKKILKKIIEEYHATDYNIVIVTHQTICSIILSIVNKYSLKHKPNKSTITNYEKGQLTLVYENGWTYKSINK